MGTAKKGRSALNALQDVAYGHGQEFTVQGLIESPACFLLLLVQKCWMQPGLSVLCCCMQHNLPHTMTVSSPNVLQTQSLKQHFTRLVYSETCQPGPKATKTSSILLILILWHLTSAMRAFLGGRDAHWGNCCAAWGLS